MSFTKGEPMTFDPAVFRQAMSQLPTGVAVVALSEEDRIHAMTVGSFTSLSLDPPLVLACIGGRAQMAPLFQKGQRFSANVLRGDQRALSTYFAGSWQGDAPPPHRFLHWEGSPRLEGSVLSLACRVDQVVEGGDHLIVIAGVQAIHLGLTPRTPLIFFDHRYHQADAGTGDQAPDIEAQDEGPQAFYEIW